MKIEIAILCILFMLNIGIYRDFSSKRDSNLEILRIVSMILIVAHHFSLHGYNFIILPFSSKKIVLDFLVLGGKVGVNIFILISAYYLVDQRISYRSLLKLVCRVKLYALIFLGLAFLFNRDIIKVKEVVRSFFPIMYQLWWFITAYFLLYLIAPYLNLFLKNISKNELKKLLLLGIILYVILNVFMRAKLFFSSFLWFIILYMIVYYIKYYSVSSQINKFFVFSMYIFMYISVLVFDYLGDKINIFKLNSLYFIRENSIFSFLFSIGIFLIFLNLKIKKSKFINYISSGTLGIYLIHENTFVREFLYQGILKNNESLEYSIYIFIYHCIISVLFIFCGTLFLGKVLDFFIENLCFKFINFYKLEEYFSEKIERILVYIIKFEKEK